MKIPAHLPDVGGWFAATGLRARMVIGLSLLMLVAVPTGVVLANRDALPEEAALRVDGTVVTKTELQRRVDVLEALYGVQEPRQEAEQDQFRRDVAKAVAVSMILERAASDQGVVVAEKAARSTLSRLIEREFPDVGRDGFVRALGNMGVNEAEVLEEIERQMLVSRLFDDVTEDVSVSEEELAAAYEERREQMVVPPRRRIRNIVVAERGTAVQVLRQARAGVPFVRLVRIFSLDASTRRSGGELGLLSRKDLESDYGRAAFRARIGGVFGPVKTRFGWNVGQVTATKAARPIPLDAVGEELRGQLETEQALAVWRSWVADRIKEADVDYASDYRPADPDSPPLGDEPGGLTGRPQGPSR